VTDPAGSSDAQGLVELIDRIERLLENSELSEIEIEAGTTGFVLRKPSAFAAAVGAAPAVAVPGSSPADGAAQQTVAPVPAAQSGPVNAVVAPLTGLYYSSPSPGAQPYVTVGSTIAVGQVIGLIEAMKLFNEIKSDRAGRVTRIYPEDGALVKAKQPLIEVEA
jgi:acetyl-CoA carboxylase biotin carboxyl carrier protein